MSDNPDADMINVRAAHMMFEGPDMTGKLLMPGDEFSCERGRAAELKVNDLIEYVKVADESPELLQISMIKAMQAELAASTDALAAAVAGAQPPPA